jgi:hypothetical protein
VDPVGRLTDAGVRMTAVSVADGVTVGSPHCREPSARTHHTTPLAIEIGRLMISPSLRNIQPSDHFGDAPSQRDIG